MSPAAHLCGLAAAASGWRAREAVAAYTVEGPKNNLPFCAELLENAEFVSGDYDTGLVGRMRS
ncbi:hypothetical protein [Nonomuraea sp. NPDC046570]|uniref:hypothetical protein n=1 Tax=Nonomuraea sp. NPDC046570 TaxID=3155255 RepID=UPI0033FC7DF4